MSQKVLLDLFCGRWGWSKAFAKRGWKCIGVDVQEPPEIPDDCEFIKANVLSMSAKNGYIEVIPYEWRAIRLLRVDAIAASSPCEEFSVHGMKHFHPNPKYPENGMRLFNHTRQLCEASGLPYVMENVRAAQKFVGQATCNAGAFHLWHNFGVFPLRFGIPFRLPRKVTKGATQMRRDGRFRRSGGIDERMYKAKDVRAAELAVIPPELANCVADYMERIIEQRKCA